MINGTQSDCKVKSIAISESTATITLLVFASKDTAVPKPFWICLKDEDGTEKIRLDAKTYWIIVPRKVPVARMVGAGFVQTLNALEDEFDRSLHISRTQHLYYLVVNLVLRVRAVAARNQG